ncbi:MAG: hypothetical protein H0W40_10945 [Methylibium sp.]|uniref:serine/threonine protein kinase n=1 Tax=Methylibium sp. TaxID=2067992 RepID=UPI0017E8A6AC|nr:hypothetical protein [Methylibium sp.]MBA3597876.1 hypothetical protein [Methylibium sp.]
MNESGPASTDLQFAVASLPAGSAVGSFVLRNALGGDEFGRFYRATASASDADVTIEEYLPAVIARRDADGTLGPRSPAQADLWAEGLQAFLQETEQMSRLDHPALLRVGPVWQARGTAYRLRAGGEGRPLAEIVDAMTEPPGEAWLRGLLDPLLGALQAVHEAGWVHGNVRPGQILVRADGSPVLLDSGAVGGAIGALLPGAQGALSETGFLAPELTDASLDWPVGPWSDLHALAQVLRYCITGQAPLPLDPDAPLATDARPMVGPRALNARYSPGLVAALERALAQDPHERPQSVADFLHAMEASALLRAVPAATPVRAQPVPREVRRESAAPAQAVAPPTRATVPLPRVAGSARAPAPLEPAWASAELPNEGDLHDPRMFELHAAETGDGRADAAVPRAGNGSRRRRRWPWALGGMLAGAALMGAFVFVGLRPMAEVQFALSPPRGDAAPLGAPGPGADPAPTTAPATAASGPLPSTPLPPVQTPGSQQAAPATPAAPAVSSEARAPTSMVREATTQDRVPRAPAPADAVAPSAAARDSLAQDRAALAEPRSALSETAAAGNDASTADAGGDRAAAPPETPEAACGSRSNFALYRCMQTQCEQTRFYTHPQCIRLRVRDELP